MSDSAADSKIISTINPADGKKIKDHKLMTDDEVNQAIEACHEAFLSWKFVPHEERAEKIKSIGNALQEKGKLKRQEESEIDLCSALCEYTAKNGPSQLADDKREFQKQIVL